MFWHRIRNEAEESVKERILESEKPAVKPAFGNNSMQLSKLNLTVCTTLLCWSASCLQASEDTPAQALARKAILQRMHDADAEDAAQAKTPPAQYYTSQKESPAQTMALAAIRKRMHAEDHTGSASIHETKMAAKESAKSRAAAKKLAAAHAKALKQAKKDAARKAKKHAPATAPGMAAAASQPGQAANVPSASRPGPAYPPVIQVRLNELLARYAAEHMSPKDYYKERAAILAVQ